VTVVDQFVLVVAFACALMGEWSGRVGSVVVRFHSKEERGQIMELFRIDPLPRVAIPEPELEPVGFGSVDSLASGSVAE
jgi:hypothetical protein